MKVGKAIVRGSILALLPMALSGCGLPVGIQIASWAIDGISMIATEKSVASHGISAATQKDCALWRVLAGDEICRETDESIQLAEAAKLDDEDDNFDHNEFKTKKGASVQVASLTPVQIPQITADPLDDEDDNFSHAEEAAPNELAIIEMEAQQLAVFPTAAGATSTKKSINSESPIQKPMPLPGIKTASAAQKTTINTSPKFTQETIQVADATGGSGLISRPLPPPVPNKIAPVSKSKLKKRILNKKKPPQIKASATPVSDEHPVSYEPVVKTDPEPRPLTQPTTQKPKKQKLLKPLKPKKIERSSPKKPAANPSRKKRLIRSTMTKAGLYYVLGSFAKPSNAYRLVKKAATLKPKVVIAHPKGKRVHRVLVGPFGKAEKSQVHRRIRAANIRGFWILRMKRPAKTERQDDSQLAALPQ